MRQISILFIFLFVPALPVALGADAEKSNIEQRLKKLESKVILLNAQVKSATRRIKALEAEVSQLKRPPNGGNDDDTKEVAPDKLGNKTALRPSTLLVGLPKNATPLAKEGWTEFNRPKANLWFQEKVEQRLFAAIGVIQSVDVIRIRNPENNNKTLGWTLNIYLKPIPIKTSWGSEAIHLRAEGDEGNRGFDRRLVLKTNEATALKARRLKRGSTIRIAGAIKSVVISNLIHRVGGGVNNYYPVRVALSDVQVGF